ncbi:hypothetical protein QVD17_04440 [Tagetes erecta]|uniref:Uncharacterized protein n=1 Tax=Tagetes erecta TaxID=13708 RepID=A0AAD8PAQ1_TARER|nr:hypothetical protein QVD17_04440 [Tagetes erecta]
MMQRYLFFTRAINFLCSRRSLNTPNPNSLTAFHFHTSKPDSSLETPNSENKDVDDVSSAELKAQIDKLYKGDFEAIPTIFESILKRKLAGKHEESDNELMNEFRQDQPNEVIDEEFDLSSSSDSDSDFDE